MKYYGEPLCHVIDYERGKEVFCFDQNGEFETEDEKLISWMKKNKPHIRCEVVELVKKPNNSRKPTRSRTAKLTM